MLDAILKVLNNSEYKGRHSGLDPESSDLFKVWSYWMPDQVRHDNKKLDVFRIMTQPVSPVEDPVT